VVDGMHLVIEFFYFSSMLSGLFEYPVYVYDGSIEIRVVCKTVQGS